MKRLVRFASIAAAVAAIIAAIRALTRDQDQLPTPATSPTGSPWPPLRPEDPTAGGRPAGGPTPTPDASPAPNPPTPEADAGPAEAREVRVPEPDGVPVATETTPATGAAWVEPTDDGGCPEGYPIKAKMSSKIFHAPGQLNYDRTTPDRCYASAEAAEADGLRAAKR